MRLSASTKSDCPYGPKRLIFGHAGVVISAPAELLAGLETRSGGRLGVVAIDTGSGRKIVYRAGETFPMCSTYKPLTAAAALRLVDRGEIALDQRIAYGQAELLEYAPVARKSVEAGFMAVSESCAAALV